MALGAAAARVISAVSDMGWVAGSHQWGSRCVGRRGPGDLGDEREVKMRIDSAEQASSQLELFFGG
jgi:hypothetical protein